MRVIYSPLHVRHNPPWEIFNGEQTPHAEVKERIEHIKEALVKQLDIIMDYPHRFPLSLIEAVHSKKYMDYIARTGREAGMQYVYPSVFPYQATANTLHPIAERGQYAFDMYTPISVTTYEAARGSAMCALTAASLVRRGEKVAYALCRPPGHHAEAARMGGYCYFNNAAVVAQYLSGSGTVAILDVDLHHGNGTQAIFYDRSDVLFVSIHARPDVKFPFFSGWETETGVGEGVGYNLNIPLGQGITNTQFAAALVTACNRITQFHPTYLVLSVGYDTHKEDPIGAFALTTQYFCTMAQKIASLNVPTVIVQEGGYNTARLGDNAVSFVRGFLGRH